MRRQVWTSLLVVGLCVLAGLGAGRFWAAQFRTLHELGRFGNTKTDCRKGVIGGAMARLTRPMLHGRVVDLGAWFGFQEIYLSDALDFDACEFAFRLDPGAWLAVELDSGAESFERLDGVRLSRHEGKPTATFRTDAKGLFESLEPVASAPLDGAWHAGRLELGPGDARLLVDGVPIAHFTIRPASSRRIGFRGGDRSALVDDVVLRHGDRTLLVEHFDRRDLLLAYGALCTLIAGGIWSAIAAALRSRSRRIRRLVPSCVLLTLAMLAWALAALDDLWLSARYPLNPLQTPHYANTMFRPEIPEVSWEARHPGRDPKRARRILFCGGSQTWGSGARVSADVWTRLVEAELDRAAPDPGWRCLDVAVSGHRLAQQVEVCESHALDEFRPEVVVVDAGHNDLDQVAFGQALIAMWEVVQRRGARLICVLEANSPETVPPDSLPQNHIVMRKLAESAHVPVLDMHAFMATVDERGFLWWDRVHLTSAGQEVLAREISARLLEILR
ncbi:MAG: SGNH/GDSL hydrolase family protein [Planctomycetota bacterium]